MEGRVGLVVRDGGGLRTTCAGATTLTGVMCAVEDFLDKKTSEHTKSISQGPEHVQMNIIMFRTRPGNIRPNIIIFKAHPRNIT